MAMDLGTLFATIDINDDGFSQKIGRAKTDLQDLKRVADSAGKVKIDVAPSGTSEVDKASQSTAKLDQAKKRADGQKVDVAPTGAGDLDKAADSATGLGESLDDAGSKAPDVAPTGASELDGAASSASDLGDRMDGVAGPDVAPSGTGELDSAGSAAADLDNALDGVSGPDVTPTGTGDVTTAAQQAGELDANLQKAGTSGRSLTVSTQPAQELSNANSAAGGLVDKIGEITTGALTKTVKWGAITSATAAIGGLGATLTRGFGRLASIDEAEAQLRGLGRSAEEIDSIIDTVDRSLQGTSFLVEDAARSAAVFSTQGVDAGRDMERMMSLLADTTAQANSNFSEMTPIFSQIIARGGLTTQTFDQLNDRATGVGEALSEHLGVSLEEVREQANDITFEEFAAAMEANIGGAAQQTGETVRGAWDNVGAAFGRLGAALAEPVFEAAPGILGNITDKVDEWTEAAGPLVEEWVEKLGPGLSDFAQNIGPQVSGALTTIKDTAGLVTPAISGIGSVMSSIPMEAYVAMLGMAVSKHTGLTAALTAGGGRMKGWGRDIAGTQAALRAQGREIGVVSAAMLTMQQRIPMVGRMGAAYRTAGDGMRLAGMESRGMAQQMTGLDRVTGTVRGSMQSFGGVMAGTVAGGFSAVRSTMGGLMTALGGPWGLAIGGATTAIFSLLRRHQEAAAETAAHEQAQRDLKNSLDETTGSITEQTRELQIKSLEESGAADTARELGISNQVLADAMTGNASAMNRVNSAISSAGATAVQNTSFWESHGAAFEKVGFSASDMADYMSGATEASDGFADAQRKVQDELGRGTYDENLTPQLRDLRDELGENSEEWAELRDSVGDANDMFEEASAAQLADQMNDLEESARRTKDAFEILGDAQLEIKDSQTISVSTDDMTEETLQQLEDIGAEVSEPFNGQVSVSFPDGMNILDNLEQIGVKAQIEDGYIQIDKDDLEASQEGLEILGLTTRELDDGRIVIDSDDEEVRQRMLELGMLVEDPMTGEVRLADNIGEVQGRMDGIDGTNLSAFVRLDDNTGAVIHNLSLVGIEARTDKNGNVIITDTTDENMARLQALGAEVSVDKNGNVVMTDNATETADNVRDHLEGLSTDGNHTITDNSRDLLTAIKNSMNSPNGDTRATHTVEEVREIRERRSLVGQLASGGRVPENAKGSRLPRNASGTRHGGYRLPTTGPGTGVTDGILGIDGNGVPSSWVDAGEWIVNGDSSDRWDGTLAAINGGRPSQIVAAMLQDLEAHANGGRVSDKVKSGTAYMDGTPYVFGGWTPAGTDCSGAVSIGVNRALGRDDFESRCGTANMSAWLSERGFQQGQGGSGDIRVGWYNGGPGGGHTAMQLGDGTFIESGGNTGGGYTIGKSAGPLSGRGFTDWMFLPSDGGEPNGGDIGDADGGAGSGSYSSYTSSAGGSAGGGGGSAPQKTVNGGAGPLLRDGSVLEAAAAAYSHQTGQPMADDVVSWGNVLGLGTTFEGENLEREQRRHEREMRAHDRNIEAAERDLAQAKNDIGEKEQALADASPEDREQAQWELDDAKDKVEDLTDQLADMRDATSDLQRTNEQLKVAVQRQQSQPAPFGITAMADGGILGNARNAQINEGSATLWAEAGPEAYIPLSSNKRARSMDIWAETGKRLGVDVMSLLNLVGSGLPGLMDGRLQFSSGDTVSLDRMGLNTEAAAHALNQSAGQAVGAVFNGPVSINDPRSWAQGQLNTAQKQLQQGLKSRMLR